MQARGRFKVGREDHRVDANDRIGPDLGHDRKEGCNRGGGLGIAGGKPEVQRDKRRLDREDQKQQHCCYANANRFFGPDQGDAV